MDSRSCVLRERFVTFLSEKDIQEMADEDMKVSEEMSRKLGNMVMCGFGFGINNKQNLIGYVILPKAEGLEVRGRFTLRKSGIPDVLQSEVQLIKFSKSENLDKTMLKDHNLNKSHLVESAIYMMKVCTYSQAEFKDKNLKTSRDRKEPHYEIQIDVEVSKGRKDLMLPQARRDSLVKDISKLLEDKGRNDMVIECQGELVPCHKAVLMARSATFAGGLGHDFEEKRKGRWVVKDAPLPAVRDMLSYIYTGDLPQGLKDRAMELLQLACFYQLQELLEAARLQLVSQLTKDNAVRVLVELEKHSLDMEDGAKEQVIKFIKESVREVVKGPDWNEFVVSYPNLVTDIMLAY